MAELKKEEVELIISHFDVGKLIEFQNLRAAHVNAVVKCRTSIGFYILKKFGNFKNRKELQHNLEVQEKLRLKGFPLPMIIKDKSGLLLHQFSKSFYCLFEYVEGREYDDNSEKDLIKAANFLGSLHAKTRNDRDLATHFKKNREMFVSQKDIQKIWDSEDGDSVLDRLEKKEELSGNEVKLKEAILKVKGYYPILLQLGSQVNDYRRKPSVVHGDFWSPQTSFCQKGEITIFDFEFMRYDDPVKDYLKALMKFTYDLNKGIFDYKKVKKFNDAYEQVYGSLNLTKEEVEWYLGNEALFLASILIRKIYHLGLYEDMILIDGILLILEDIFVDSSKLLNILVH